LRAFRRKARFFPPNHIELVMAVPANDPEASKQISVAIPGPSTTRETKQKIIKPQIGRYVTRNEAFLRHVLDARERMQRYAQKVNAPRPLNILLAAGPGSGKSFLIKQLIGAIDAKAQFEELYIASLDSVAEIYHMFQRCNQ